MNENDSSKYWSRTSRMNVSRRGVVKGIALSGLGLAGAALVGCGGSSGTSPAQTSGAAPAVGAGNATAAASSTAAASANAKKGGRLQLYSLTTAPNLDPMLSLSYQTHNRISLAYSLLVEMRRGPKGIYDTVIGPDIAASWETASDGLTWTFKLRSDVKWANVAPMNGRALTAEDVAYTFERNLSPLNGNLSRYDMLAGPPKAVDAKTVQFKLKYPHPGFFFNLAAEPSEIQPREAVEKEGDLKNWGAGSGPFIVTKYDAQTIIQYKKNPDYYDAAHVYLDGVDTSVIPDKATAIANFRSGQLDAIGTSMAHPLAPNDAEAVSKSVPKAPRLDAMTTNGPVLQMNFAAPQFKDLRIRQAINMAIDRKAFIAAIGNGVGQLSGTYPYTRFPEYALAPDEIAKLLKYDVAEAKKLMAAAGVGNGINAQILWMPSAKAALEMHVEMLKQIGITLDTATQAVDYPAWVSKTFNGQYTGMAEWGYAVGSIWDYMGFHHSKGNRNGPQTKLPEVDAMIDKVLRTTDPQSQVEQVKSIERHVLSKVLYILPSFMGQASEFTQPYVKDHLSGHGAMRGVYLSNYVRHAWLDK